MLLKVDLQKKNRKWLRKNMEAVKMSILGKEKQILINLCMTVRNGYEI